VPCSVWTAAFAGPLAPVNPLKTQCLLSPLFTGFSVKEVCVYCLASVQGVSDTPTVTSVLSYLIFRYRHKQCDSTICPELLNIGHILFCVSEMCFIKMKNWGRWWNGNVSIRPKYWWYCQRTSEILWYWQRTSEVLMVLTAHVRSTDGTESVGPKYWWYWQRTTEVLMVLIAYVRNTDGTDSVRTK
jgi:hypothetical protein